MCFLFETMVTCPGYIFDSFESVWFIETESDLTCKVKSSMIRIVSALEWWSSMQVRMKESIIEWIDAEGVNY